MQYKHLDTQKRELIRKRRMLRRKVITEYLMAYNNQILRRSVEKVNLVLPIEY